MNCCQDKEDICVNCRIKEDLTNLKKRFNKLVMDLEQILNGPFSYDSEEYLDDGD